MPPILGYLFNILTVQLLPLYLLFSTLSMMFSFARVNQIVQETRQEMNVFTK
ncbi:hypothetical protein [Desemzia sp. FAM 24101]|uniref:hypothetical protein n=1 Tax=unclassified Desemzia TaxID=2685243 RepID=UPI003889B2BD